MGGGNDVTPAGDRIFFPSASLCRLGCVFPGFILAILFLSKALFLMLPRNVKQDPTRYISFRQLVGVALSTIFFSHCLLFPFRYLVVFIDLRCVFSFRRSTVIDRFFLFSCLPLTLSFVVSVFFHIRLLFVCFQYPSNPSVVLFLSLFLWLSLFHFRFLFSLFLLSFVLAPFVWRRCVSFASDITARQSPELNTKHAHTRL